MRFPKTEVLALADSYGYADDIEVQEIGVRSRMAGYYTRGDFLGVCEWKTRGRPRRHYQRNSEDDVRRVTAIALSSADEKTRIMSGGRLARCFMAHSFSASASSPQRAIPNSRLSGLVVSAMRPELLHVRFLAAIREGMSASGS
jgi:hypothetical protein